MAAAKKEAAAPVEAPPPKKKSKLMMIVIVAVVLLAGGGGGAYWFLGRHPSGEKPAHVEVKPVFSTLETFTVNLKVEENPQFLQVGLSLKLASSGAVDALKESMPEVRNSILLLLSSRKASELLTLEGKQKLSADVVAAVNKIIAPKSPAPAAAVAETTEKAADEAPAEGAAKEGEPAEDTKKAPKAATKEDEPAEDPKKAPKAAAKGPVLGVLFTSFIIQ